MKSVSGKKMLQILMKNGWQVIRIKGSHYRLQKENKFISLPIHQNQDLKIGLLRSIMKDAGLTEDDLG